MSSYVHQSTPQYKSFLKRSVVEALTESFVNHTDPTVSNVKVGIDFTEDDFHLPAVIIKFNEQRLPNAGVGHFEWLPGPNQPNPLIPTQFIEYQHRMYKGTIEFEIFGLSSADRDVISDALIEVLAMNEVSVPGQAFIDRFYNKMAATPFGLWHFPTLNVDQIDPGGEQFMLAPWNPEDQAVYQTSYSVIVYGEFYSYVPPNASSTKLLTEVDVYAWPSQDGVTPLDPSSPAPPVSANLYDKITGFPTGTKKVPTG